MGGLSCSYWFTDFFMLNWIICYMGYTSLSQSVACHLLRVTSAGSLCLSCPDQVKVSLHEAFFHSPCSPGFTFPCISYGLAVARRFSGHEISKPQLESDRPGFHPDSAKLIPIKFKVANHSLSKSQFPHLKNGYRNTYLIVVRIKWVHICECFCSLGRCHIIAGCLSLSTITKRFIWGLGLLLTPGLNSELGEC